jgi:S1-C subfamily serine protease
VEPSDDGADAPVGERAGWAQPVASTAAPSPTAPAVALGPVGDPAAPTGEVPPSADPTDEVPVGSPTPTQPVPPVSAVSSEAFLPLHWREPGSGDHPGSTDPASVSTATGPPGVPSTSVVPVWGPVIPPTPAADTAGSSSGRPRGWLWAVVSGVAALIGALIGGGIVAAVNHDGGSTTVKEISAGPALLNGTTNIETVIAKVRPAIVSIAATSPASASQSILGGGTGGVQEDQGTGMIITSDGQVVTNNHVIAGATTITVTLYGSLKALPATLIDTDPTNDVALLQIDNQANLPTVSYGDSDSVQVGDAVVAIGNALGLAAGTPTVTQGIISATGRTVQASDPSGNNTESLTNMFQTDAAINPGNSGGPLVDSSGTVIGMNTAVAANEDGTAQAQNIGFAIPSNKIEQLLPELRNKAIGNSSQSGPAYLGVQIETLTSQLRSAYNFVPSQGAVVLAVETGSPADAAGLHQGDVITSLSGKPITSADQLGTAIQADKPGQTVKIGLYRGPTQMTVTATLGTMPAADQQQAGS